MNNLEFYTLIILIGFLGVFDYIFSLLGKELPRWLVKLLLLIFVSTYILKSCDDIKGRSDFVRLQKDFTSVQGDFARVQNNVSGVHKLSAGGYEVGITRFEDPVYYNEKLNLSRASLQKGDFTSALNYINDAAKLDTENSYIDFTRVTRAQIFIYRNDIKGALDELIKLDEKNVSGEIKAPYFRTFIFCYQNSNNFQKANEYAEKLLDLQDPIPRIGKRIKDHGCTVQEEALQDKDCTPGMISPEATVEEICTSDYSKRVSNVSAKMRGKIFEEYGITHYNSRDYQADLLIPKELGGTNDIANLWPEARQPLPGFREKDKVEKYLYDEVCSGKMSLTRAQRKIANNWVNVYKAM